MSGPYAGMIDTPYGPIRLVAADRPGGSTLTVEFPEGMPADVEAVHRQRIVAWARTLDGRVIEPKH